MFKFPRQTRQRKRSYRRPRGTVSVEMAMVAPVIFLMIFGSIEFGRMMMVRQALTNAARDGCRKACLVTTRDSKDAELVAREALIAVIQDATGNESLMVDVSPAFTQSPASGTAIKTTVEIACADVSWLPPFFTADARIRCSASMNRE